MISIDFHGNGILKYSHKIVMAVVDAPRKSEPIKTRIVVCNGQCETDV